MAACIGASAAGSHLHGHFFSGSPLHARDAPLGGRSTSPRRYGQCEPRRGPAWNVWADHTDSLSQRDTGWLQVYVATAQEAYDTTLMAFRIAEDNEVLLPVMVNLDGFLLSHTMQDLETQDRGHSSQRSTSRTPSTRHTPLPTDPSRARRIITGSGGDGEVDAGGPKGHHPRREGLPGRFGRRYGVTEEYRCEDADVLVIAMGTLAREAEVAVDGSGLKYGRGHAPAMVPPLPDPRSHRQGGRGHRPGLLLRLRRGTCPLPRSTTRTSLSA